MVATLTRAQMVAFVILIIGAVLSKIPVVGKLLCVLSMGNFLRKDYSLWLVPGVEWFCFHWMPLFKTAFSIYSLTLKPQCSLGTVRMGDSAAGKQRSQPSSRVPRRCSGFKLLLSLHLAKVCVRHTAGPCRGMGNMCD